MKEFLGIDKNEWEYLRFIIFQNFVVAIFILLFLWEGWDVELFRFVTFGFLMEFLLLVAAIPLYFMFAWKLFNSMKKKFVKKISFIFAMVMATLVIGGTGIHMVANQIHMNIDTPMVEFYDEILSHYMLWVGILGLNVFFGVFQDSIPLKKNLGKKEIVVISLSGVLQGIVAALGILESRFGLWGLIGSFIFLVVIHLDLDTKDYRKYPVFIFYNVALLTIILVILSWVIKYGAFAEPSMVGFGRF